MPSARATAALASAARSAAAASQMEAIGLTVTDLGSIEEAERATGVAVVR
jgi:hypothetical protein